jgi:hypothetical protein
MSRLNAIDVAAVIHTYQPINSQRLALYFQTPLHRVTYAVQWLLKYGYVRKDSRHRLSVVTVGGEPLQRAVLWRDQDGAQHWLVGTLSGDAEFLLRNGWVQV